MNATQQRESAIREAQTDSRQALSLAAEVTDPWFRCQALAWAARFGPQDQVIRVAHQATQAAATCSDLYERAACLAWPLRALVERGMTEDAREILSTALAASDRIPHPVRRASALLLIAQAAWPLGRPSQESVVKALLDAYRETHGWRAGMIMHDLVLMVSGEDRKWAEEIGAAMQEGRYRRRCLRALSDGQSRPPRDFFW